LSVLDVAVVVTLWGAVGAHVLASDPATLLAPLRRVGLLARVLALNLLLVPLVAALAATLLVPDEAYAAGVVMYGAASAGAIGIAAVRLGRGDLALALPLVVILELASVVSLPAWSSVLLPRTVEAPVADVVGVVLKLIVLPAALAAGVRALWPRAAVRLERPAAAAATAGLAAVLVIVFARDWSLLVAAVQSGVPLATGVLLVTSLAGGWLVAGGGRAQRTAVALVSAQRGATLAFAVATTSFADTPGTAAAVVVTALITLVALGGLATALRLRTDRPSVHAHEATRVG
jgi:predicted Na+-dependent transporter